MLSYKLQFHKANMKESRSLMGMTVTVEVIDAHVTRADIDRVYQYFTYIDETFSTYKENSEITKINKGILKETEYSDDMREVLRLCEETKHQTHGYFNIQGRDGNLDPSGLVKGWSIYHASELFKDAGFKNFYIDAGGDIQVAGHNAMGEKWNIGIRNPFKNPFEEKEIVKVVYVEERGVATSGTYIRGQHIYSPYEKDASITEIVSLTVIGPNIYEADRFATAAFAMGKKGIEFIEELPDHEGYMIDAKGIATMTSGFDKYLIK